MLQITTGRYYGSEAQVHETPQNGLLFSNAHIWGPLEFSGYRLTPIDRSKHQGVVTQYYVEYTNRVQATPDGGGLIATGGHEIMRQLRVLCSFGLRAFFAPDAATVEHICHTSRAGHQVRSGFLSSHAVPEVRCSQEAVDELTAFADHFLTLERAAFTAGIRAMTSYVHALEVLPMSVELAYSLLVFGLETLAQEFDGYEPCWNDYPEDVRLRMDGVLDEIPDTVSKKVRGALIEGRQFRLGSRYVEFVTRQLHAADYFRQPSRSRPARASCVRRAVRNSYRIRSQFAHSLSPLLRQLHMEQISREYDTFEWNSEVYFTVGGLFNAAHATIRGFILGLEPGPDGEEFDWYSHLPGIVQFKAAPKYWVWKVSDDITKRARARYSGYLQHVVDLHLGTESGPPDMRGFCRAVETRLAKQRAPAHAHASLLCIHQHFNSIIHPAERSAGHEELGRRYEADLASCTIETLAMRVASKAPSLPWTASQMIGVYEDYDEKRFHRGGVVLPHRIEVAILLAIYNRLHSDGSQPDADPWRAKAVDESAGLPKIQDVLRSAEGAPFDWAQMLLSAPPAAG